MELNKRPIKPWVTFPDGEVIINMTIYKDMLIVCTDKHIYQVDENGNYNAIELEE